VICNEEDTDGRARVTTDESQWAIIIVADSTDLSAFKFPW